MSQLSSQPGSIECLFAIVLAVMVPSYPAAGTATPSVDECGPRSDRRDYRRRPPLRGKFGRQAAQRPSGDLRIAAHPGTTGQSAAVARGGGCQGSTRPRQRDRPAPPELEITLYQLVSKVGQRRRSAGSQPPIRVIQPLDHKAF